MDIERNKIRGLTMREVDRRRRLYGSNVFWSKASRSWWAVIGDIFEQPIFVLLMIASLIYLFLGELKDGVALFAVVLVVLALTFIQNKKSQNAINALRDMSQPFAIVLRDQAMHQVPVKDVVLGDVLSLNEGQQIGADACLIQASYMEVDESLMTGESTAVTKSVRGKLMAGTFVIRGEGLARVISIGIGSSIGKMDQALQQIEQTASPIQEQTTRLIRDLASIVFFGCLAIWLLQGWLHGNWLEAFLAAVVLALSLLPEEYAVVLSMFPALGAKRLAAEGVLTTNIHAIEALGACTVICTDKTGTLTQNLMTPEMVVVPTKAGLECLDVSKVGKDSSPVFYDVLTVAILATSDKSFDAMDKSLREICKADVSKYGHVVETYSLQSDLRVMAQAWRSSPDQGSNVCIAAKGAPEDVMRLCRMSDQNVNFWSDQVNQMAQNGLRVIAVARSEQAGGQISSTLVSHHFQWQGLIGFRDPLRSQIPDAVLACHKAGIRVIMITGDHPETALAIARQAGLGESVPVLGDSFLKMTTQEMVACVNTHSVFARVSPLVKVKIIKTLQSNQEIVTMIGDGMNDVVALQAANVAVAMGLRGTDAARNAADLILLTDDFSSLIKGVSLGRRIFVNMQKSMSYLLAVHLPIAGLAILPMLADTPSLLLPMHIACLELFIDPACSVVFENEPSSAKTMTTPPRDVRGHVLNPDQIRAAISRGLFALLMVAISYLYAVSQTDDLSKQRTIAFVTLLVGNVMLMISYRQYEAIKGYGLVSNYRMLMLIAIAFGLLACVIYWPVLAQSFKFAPLDMRDLFWAVSIGAFTVSARYFGKA